MSELLTLLVKMTEHPRNKRWKWAAIVQLDRLVTRSVPHTNRYAEVLSRSLRNWCFEQAGLPARSVNTPGRWTYSHVLYCEPSLTFDDPALAMAFRLRWHGEKMNCEEERDRLIALRHARKK